MAYTDILDSERFCFGFADQATNLTTKSATALASYDWLDSLFPEVTEEREIADEARAVQQRGAVGRVSVGARRFNVTFRTEMPGQAAAYNPTSGAPAANGAWKLVQDAFGGNATGAYLAAGVAAASTAKLINWASGTPKLGCGYAIGTGLTEGLVKAMGWLKSLASQAGTLFADIRAAPTTGDNIYQMLTLFPGSTAPTPKTFALLGDSAYQSIKWIGGLPKRITFTWDNANKLWGAFDYRVYGGDAEDSDGGTIYAPPDLKVLEPSKGSGGSRILVGANRISSLTDGTADADGTCGLRNVQLVIDFPHYENTCWSKTERVDAVRVRSPKITLSFWAPRVTDLKDPTYTTQTLWHAALDRQHPLSFSFEMGDTIGALVGMLLPGTLVRQVAAPTMIDGAWGFNVTADVGAYTSDGASTDAGNSVTRIALG